MIGEAVRVHATVTKTNQATNLIIIQKMPKEVEQQQSFCALALGCLTFPITIPCSLWVLPPKHDALVFNFGVLTEIHRQEGIHCSNCWGREISMISTADISVDLPTQKITDSIGNPIVVSAVVQYRFIDPFGPLIHVQNAQNFVSTQAAAILKQVVGKYSYDDLKVQSTVISKELIESLQEAVFRAGAQVITVRLNELNYAPEIAQAMLKKQAAQALIDARHLIVKGAVDIAMQAVEELASKGLQMEEKDKFSLVSSLLIVTAGDKDATPTLAI
jgi:regulator of protease activity HflC (stomatin/prohibitin superfamily)